MSETHERRYSFIFSKLLQEPDDLVGLLAYGIYKNEKIAYIEAFKTKHLRGPSDEELDTFHEHSIARMDQYRTIAESKLSDLLDELISDQTEQTKKELESKYKEDIKRDIAKAKTGWLPAIAQSFIGSVFFVIAIGASVFIMLGWRDGTNYLIRESARILTGDAPHSAQAKTPTPPTVP